MSNRIRIKNQDADAQGMKDSTPIDLEKLRSIGWNRRSSQTNGELRKRVTDELGNTVTQHWKGDRQDVQINAPSVHVRTTQNESR